jgi:hypothetical protein
MKFVARLLLPHLLFWIFLDLIAIFHEEAARWG